MGRFCWYFKKVGLQGFLVFPTESVAFGIHAVEIRQFGMDTSQPEHARRVRGKRRNRALTPQLTLQFL